jgi:hypothetical protein
MRLRACFVIGLTTDVQVSLFIYAPETMDVTLEQQITSQYLRLQSPQYPEFRKHDL